MSRERAETLCPDRAVVKIFTQTSTASRQKLST